MDRTGQDRTGQVDVDMDMDMDVVEFEFAFELYFPPEIYMRWHRETGLTRSV